MNGKHCVKRDTSISPYSVRMRDNTGKMRTRITPSTDSFYAVKILLVACFLLHCLNWTLTTPYIVAVHIQVKVKLRGPPLASDYLQSYKHTTMKPWKILHKNDKKKSQDIIKTTFTTTAKTETRLFMILLSYITKEVKI